MSADPRAATEVYRRNMARRARAAEAARQRMQSAGFDVPQVETPVKAAQPKECPGAPHVAVRPTYVCISTMHMNMMQDQWRVILALWENLGFPEEVKDEILNTQHAKECMDLAMQICTTHHQAMILHSVWKNFVVSVIDLYLHNQYIREFPAIESAVGVMYHILNYIQEVMKFTTLLPLQPE